MDGVRSGPRRYIRRTMRGIFSAGYIDGPKKNSSVHPPLRFFFSRTIWVSNCDLLSSLDARRKIAILFGSKLDFKYRTQMKKFDFSAFAQPCFAPSNIASNKICGRQAAETQNIRRPYSGQLEIESYCRGYRRRHFEVCGRIIP